MNKTIKNSVIKSAHCGSWFVMFEWKASSATKRINNKFWIFHQLHKLHKVPVFQFSVKNGEFELRDWMCAYDMKWEPNLSWMLTFNWWFIVQCSFLRLLLLHIWFSASQKSFQNETTAKDVEWNIRCTWQNKWNGK